jgi:Beta-lactamase
MSFVLRPQFFDQGSKDRQRLRRHASNFRNQRSHIGSVTKAMSATVIAALVEQGRLGWATTAPRRSRRRLHRRIFAGSAGTFCAVHAIRPVQQRARS